MKFLIKSALLHILVLLLVYNLSNCVNGHDDSVTRQLQRPGPQYYPSRGEPWPKPQLRNLYNDSIMIIRPPIFRFKVLRYTCDMVEDALKRYYSIILKTVSHSAPIVNLANAKHNKSWKSDPGFKGYLDVLQVDLMAPCESMPHESMDEAYEIKIGTSGFEGTGLLTASSNWGILRGLETFVQLLYPADDFSSIQIKTTLILDYPRFSYRSVLLDTSRHFLSMKILKQNLDLMAFNKYNVFHWHIVDDQSFPYQSRKFPQLSDKGAYQPYTHVYTQQNIAEIIEYARLRGIRVVAEFDTPGHTQAWGPAIPGLLTPCYNKEGQPDGTFGPIDPTNEKNFEFIHSFFEEVVSVFPDKYLHLGGDEVYYDCWKSSPLIAAFMAQQNMTDYAEVEQYYMQRLVNIVQSYPKNSSYIVWQETIDNGVQVKKDAIVHVWKNVNVPQEMSHVTSLGYKTLFSSCWYLNKISYGIDWTTYYDCDPQNFNGTNAQKRLVLGGGPAMWTEYVDSANIIARLWPRASLPAERLWSDANVRNKSDAARRLEEHRCRLLKRGYQLQPPNGPGFCGVEWD
ncbi:unnamed protein product [Orchesella dallaii]|uniref:Beta-hexosaminidase n=1 Tax=Orchesella dallaii TaxID=48710 RepID=A0ABP1S628_9HEXA